MKSATSFFLTMALVLVGVISTYAVIEKPSEMHKAAVMENGDFCTPTATPTPTPTPTATPD